MRFYDGALGRFLARDMLHRAVAGGKITEQELRAKGIELSENPYVAFNNNPLRFVDPAGREDKKIDEGTTTFTATPVVGVLYIATSEADLVGPVKVGKEYVIAGKNAQRKVKITRERTAAEVVGCEYFKGYKERTSLFRSYLIEVEGEGGAAAHRVAGYWEWGYTLSRDGQVKLSARPARWVKGGGEDWNKLQFNAPGPLARPQGLAQPQGYQTYGLKAGIRFRAKDHRKTFYWSQALAETAVRQDGNKESVGWLLDKSSPALKGAFLNQAFLGEIQATSSPRMTDTPSFQIEVPTTVRIIP